MKTLEELKKEMVTAKAAYYDALAAYEATRDAWEVAGEAYYDAKNKQDE